jgi:hypothetical protein
MDGLATPADWGWRVATRGPSRPPLLFFFLNFFLKKTSLFIYLFFNIFFIKMNTCRHLIDLMWR